MRLERVVPNDLSMLSGRFREWLGIPDESCNICLYDLRLGDIVTFSSRMIRSWMHWDVDRSSYSESVVNSLSVDGNPNAPLESQATRRLSLPQLSQRMVPSHQQHNRHQIRIRDARYLLMGSCPSDVPYL